MTTINGNQETKLSQFNLLRLVVDQRVGVLQNIVMDMHHVKEFNQLPKAAQDAIIYLCYMELDKTSQQLYDLYDLTPITLRAVMKRGHAMAEAMKSEDNDMYIICQLYRASFKNIKMEFETVESNYIKAS